MSVNRRKLLDSLKEYFPKHLFIIIFLFLILQTILNVIYPFIYKFFIDQVLFDNNLGNLKYVIGGILLWTLLMIFVNSCLKRIQIKFLLNLKLKLKDKIFDNILKQHISEYQKISASEYKQIIEDDINEMENFFKQDIFNFSLSICTTILLIIVMFCLNPILFFLCIVFFCISYFETELLNRKVKENSKRLREEISNENRIRMMEMEHYLDIKCLNIKNVIIENFERRASILSKYVLKEKILQYINKYFGALNHDLITRFFIYTVGGIIVVKNQFTTSSFLVFLGFYETFVKNVRVINESNFSIANKEVKIKKILNILKEPKEKEKKNISQKENEIICKNLCFRYGDNRKNVIDEFSYKFCDKHIYLLDGKSGVGKSTLLKLILRECYPQKGSIFFNNINIYNISDREFYSYIASVNTDSKIFDGTIRDNLLIANENASLQELESACSMAKFDIVIKKLPHGLDYHVGENAIKLSGGEKERLVLSRLFLTKAKIFLLDEALSEIPLSDELEIYQNLIERNPEAIFIIISHRMSKLNFGEKVILFKTV